MTDAEIDSQYLYLAKQFLSDEFYEQFKENMQILRLPGEITLRPQSLMYRAFHWAQTEQGDSYWRTLANLQSADEILSLAGWYMGWDEDNFDDLDLSLDI